jgi:16S rRNA (guanine527-N7)-methyltransferase
MSPSGIWSCRQSTLDLGGLHLGCAVLRRHGFHVKSDALAALCDRHGLAQRQQAQLAAILAELAHDERAPTSVRDPRAAIDVHLADSLVALDLEALRGAHRIADLGAGAGFPGLALAVALPSSEVVLIESQARKCAFMERVATAATVRNVRVLCARVEEWGQGGGESDVVTARALAPQPVVLEYAAPLLRLGGTLVDWRGRRDSEEEAAAAGAAEELGLRLAEILRVEPYAGVHNHHLHVYVKGRQTPPGFPRRAGVARKRPLGASKRSSEASTD